MNKQNDLVSIIMPAYNASRFLPDAIESVMAQSYDAWELIVVDDCSKDDSVSVIQRYCERDGRVKLLRNSENTGPAITRNNAINNAAGRYIAFLDSDDVWHPEKLRKQIDAMTDQDYVFTYTAYHRISEDGAVAGRTIDVPVRLTYRQLLRNTAIVTSSVVLDISEIGRIQMKDTYYDDFACWLDVLRRGFAAYGIQDDLVRYRVASTSVSRNKLNSAIKVWDTYRSIERLGLVTSMWSFFGYAYHAYQKYRNYW